jgi:hypothetical protein
MYPRTRIVSQYYVHRVALVVCGAVVNRVTVSGRTVYQVFQNRLTVVVKKFPMLGTRLLSLQPRLLTGSYT